MITGSFYLGLATHTRLAQQVIGINHETELQAVLYDHIVTAVKMQGVKTMLATEMHEQIERDRHELQDILERMDFAEDKNQLLHDARNIEQRIILAVEILESLSND